MNVPVTKRNGKFVECRIQNEEVHFGIRQAGGLADGSRRSDYQI